MQLKHRHRCQLGGGEYNVARRLETFRRLERRRAPAQARLPEGPRGHLQPEP